VPRVISSSISINRPIEEVFAVLTDVEKTERWFPLNVKEWWTSEPPHRVGSTRRARVTIGWFTTENDAVATVHEPPTLAVMRGTSPNAPFEATLRFEPVGAGTRVYVTIELSLRGPARLVGGMFARWYGGSWERGLAKLKAMMEEGEL
jgi:carbon monoxide dehydrogenase subunit G